MLCHLFRACNKQFWAGISVGLFSGIAISLGLITLQQNAPFSINTQPLMLRDVSTNSSEEGEDSKKECPTLTTSSLSESHDRSAFEGAAFENNGGKVSKDKVLLKEGVYLRSDLLAFLGASESLPPPPQDELGDSLEKSQLHANMQSENPDERNAALSSYVSKYGIPDDLDVTKALTEADEDTVGHLLNALSRTPERAPFDAIRQLLFTNSSPFIKQLALQTLGQLSAQQPSNLKTLLTEITTQEGNEEVVQEARAMLTHIETMNENEEERSLAQ